MGWWQGVAVQAWGDEAGDGGACSSGGKRLHGWHALCCACLRAAAAWLACLVLCLLCSISPPVPLLGRIGAEAHGRPASVALPLTQHRRDSLNRTPGWLQSFPSTHRREVDVSARDQLAAKWS